MRLSIVSSPNFHTRDDIIVAALARSALDAPESVAPNNVKIAIYDRIQAKWWNDGGGVWQVAKTSVNMTEFGVDAVGLYTYNLTAANHGLGSVTELYVEVLRDDTSDVDMQSVHVTVDLQDQGVMEVPVLTGASITVEQLLYALRVVFLGNQEIDDAAKQHIHFMDDNVTTAFAFNLKDAAGVSSAREVFIKERV